ncbi:MAG TPA: copper chaperone PCu(A)C, partial [Rhodospirillales bacterium]|nr:copper chaperone PCu(A)C [Rhodospirillales bacterium]
MRARISKYRCIHNLISLVIFLFVILTLDTSKILYANENTYNIGSLRISSFYLRGTIQRRPAAAYMTIQNSGQISDSLLSASSLMAGMIDFHETRVESGVAKMRQLRHIR